MLYVCLSVGYNIKKATIVRCVIESRRVRHQLKTHLQAGRPVVMIGVQPGQYSIMGDGEHGLIWPLCGAGPLWTPAGPLWGPPGGVQPGEALWTHTPFILCPQDHADMCQAVSICRVLSAALWRQL
jgi:hypothetical protein